jgi:protein-histidine pros-kinase
MPDKVLRVDANDLFEKLFEFSPDAIVVSDHRGKISEVNAQVEKLFGYSRSELLGEPIEILVPERFHSTHPKHRADYAAEPRVRAGRRT